MATTFYDDDGFITCDTHASIARDIEVPFRNPLDLIGNIEIESRDAAAQMLSGIQQNSWRALSPNRRNIQKFWH